MAEKAILYDATRCTGCRGCQAACKQWNDLEAEETSNWGSYENPPDLTARTWLKMRFIETSDNGTLRWLFNRRSCMHCTDAGCVRACPSQALYHDDLGFVGVDRGRCTGCGYCVEACPFDVPRMDGSRWSVSAKADKCTFCMDRVPNGLEPACVKTCPPKALIYGDRADLVAIGKSRVASLGENARLYGDTELDGLHVMYVLDGTPEEYGLPADPKVSDVTVAWQQILKPLGYAVVGLVALGLAVNYMVARARIVEK